ncbi:MAG: hypothetical protein ACI4QL_04175, partial [Candidatus Fimimonas sp.]
MKRRVQVIILVVILVVSCFQLSACDAINQIKELRNEVLLRVVNMLSFATPGLEYELLQNGTYSVCGYSGDNRTVIIPSKY